MGGTWRFGCPLVLSGACCALCAVIRDGRHTHVRRHRQKLEKDKQRKVWVAKQRQKISTDSAEVACAIEMDMARERYDADAKKTKEELVRPPLLPPSRCRPWCRPPRTALFPLWRERFRTLPLPRPRARIAVS